MAKEPACRAGDAGDLSSIPGEGRYPGGGNGNPLQYACLKNLMDKGAWWHTVQSVDWVTEYAGTHEKNNDTLLGSAHFLAGAWQVLIWESSSIIWFHPYPLRTVGWWPSSIRRWDPEDPRLVTCQSHHVWCYQQIWAVGSGPFCNSALMFSSWGDLRIVI